MSDEHFLVRCRCGRVISQCRCPGPKRVTVSPGPCRHTQAEALPEPATPRSTHVRMSSDAREENEACEAIVVEFRSLLAQHATPAPILQLCDELAGRIKLRRLLASEQP